VFPCSRCFAGRGSTGLREESVPRGTPRAVGGALPEDLGSGTHCPINSIVPVGHPPCGEGAVAFGTQTPGASCTSPGLQPEPALGPAAEGRIEPS
jgi:hypothetical protein